MRCRITHKENFKRPRGSIRVNAPEASRKRPAAAYTFAYNSTVTVISTEMTKGRRLPSPLFLKLLTAVAALLKNTIINN